MQKCIFIILLSLSVSAFAASKAETSQNNWLPAANKVCEKIRAALPYYAKNDIKNAHLTAMMAYFKGYDAEIEPAVRVTLGGPHVFSIEKQFREYAKLMTKNPDQTQFKMVKEFADLLCLAVRDDAKELNKANVPHQVFKVE